MEMVEVTIRGKTLNALLAVIEATCSSPNEGLATLLVLARDIDANYLDITTVKSGTVIERFADILSHIDQGETHAPSLSDVPADSA